MSEVRWLLGEAVGRVIQRHQDSAHDSEDTIRSLGVAFAEMALWSALVPEELGGFGAEWAGCSEVARLWGYHAVPVPLVEPLLGNRLAAIAGVPSYRMGGGISLASVQAQLTRVNKGWRLIGSRISATAPSDGAPVYLLAEDERRQVWLASLPAESLNRASSTRAFSGGPLLYVPVLDAAVSRDEVRALPHSRSAAALLAAGSTLLAAGMVGAMERAIEVAVDHANTRTQFGRPIARFQALQNMIAAAASEAAAAAAAVDEALRLLDTREDALFECLIAKARAGQAAGKVAAAAHQVLGAVGFSQDHPLHRFTMRLWSWRDDWGRQLECEAAIGRKAASVGGEGLWSFLVDR